MNIYTVIYSFKVWITSLLLTPLIVIIVYLLISLNESFDQIGSILYAGIIIYALSFIAGAAMSFCSWLAFTLTIALILYLPVSKKAIRWFIFIAGVVVTIGTFFIITLIIEHSISLQELVDLLTCKNILFSVVMYSYTFFIACGTWFYRLDLDYLFPQNLNQTPTV